jgi:hypothetical protein
MKKIYFNSEACEADIKARQGFYSRINAFSKDLEAEGIVLTNDILGQFLSRGIPYLSELLVQAGAKQYERAGITVTSVILGGLDQAARAAASQFEKHLLPLQHAQHSAHISWNEANILDDGQAVFSDPEKKEIQKRHTVYLKKESEPLYEKLVQVAEYLNQCSEELKEENLDLMETLKVIMNENSFVQDANMKLHPRGDIILLLNRQGKIEVNPVIFS